MRFFEFADFCLDTDESRLFRNGQAVQLPPKVFDTLFVLVKNQGRTVTKDDLIREVWRETFVEENNLTQNIFILRQTLGEKNGSGQKFIETVPRRGYRFLPEVRQVEETSLKILNGNPSSEKILSEASSAKDTRQTSAPENLNVFKNTHRKPPFLSGISRRSVVLTVVLLSLVCAAVIFLLRFYAKEKDWSPERIAMKRLSESGKLFGVSISPDGNSIVYVLRDGKSHSLRLKNILTDSEITLVPPADLELNSPTFSPDGNFIYYGRTPLNQKNEIFQIPIFGGIPRRVAENSMSGFSLSPDGQKIAFPRFVPLTKTHQIIVGEINKNTEKVIVERDDPNYYQLWGPAPAWSPDGTKLIVAAGKRGQEQGSLVEINLADGAEREIKTNKSWFLIGNLVWTDADKLIVSAMENKSSNGQLWQIILPNGEASRITNDFNDYLQISLPKSADKIVALQEINNFHLWLYNAETRVSQQLTFGENRGDGLGGVAFAPDGKIIYTASNKEELNLYEFDLATNETRQLTKHLGRNSEPRVSPDGQSVVFVSDLDGSGIHRIWVMNRDGSSAHQLTQISPNDKLREERTPNFSPDGRFVYYLSFPDSQGVYFKIPIGGGEREPILSKFKDISFPAVSPDGKFLAFGGTINEGGSEICVRSLENAIEEEKFFNFPAFRNYSRWMPLSSQILITINHSLDGNNLVLHNLAKGAENYLTDFSNERIERFDVSPDGNQFVLSRGNSFMDALLIEKSSLR